MVFTDLKLFRANLNDLNCSFFYIQNLIFLKIFQYKLLIVNVLYVLN